MTKRKSFGIVLIMVAIIATIFTFTHPITAHAAAKKAPKLNKTKVTLTITKKKTKPSVQLKVKNTAGKKVKWSTNKKNIVKVSKNGKVTAKSKGTAMVFAKVNKKTLRCKITVKDKRVTNTAPVDNKPEPAPTPECDHTYEDHWATFEEYYEDTPSANYFCYCGLFEDEKAYQQHLFEMSSKMDGWAREPWEKCMGLHGTAVRDGKSTAGSILINGEPHLFVQTKYIDKRTCTKCGVVRTTWDMPSARPTANMAPAIVPSGTPVLPPAPPSINQ